jgi:CzcA family heavy metal efflux pump
MTLGDLVGRNRAAIFGLTAFLAIGGAIAAAHMPVAIFPEVTFHRITVIAHTAPLPVEHTVSVLTQPLETAAAGVLGVESIRSTTSRGSAQLDLLVSPQTNMVTALQMVQAAVEQARPELPPDTAVETRPLDTSAFPIIDIAVSSSERTLADVSDLARYEIAPQLRTIAGVYRVDLQGAKVREYAVIVDPDALTARHLDLAAIENAIRNASIVAPAGQVRDGHQLALAVVRGAATEANRLLDVVVAQDGTTPVTLAAIAHVEPSVREDFVRTVADGQAAVLLGVSMQPNGDAVAISRQLSDRLRALAQAHPQYRFTIAYDQAELVRSVIANVQEAIALGVLLAVATLFVFTGDWRATGAAAAVIPATVLITCLVLHALGMSFNLMTLGAIAAGIGLILDDAIVVIENVHRHAVRNEPIDMAAALNEITRALVGSTLTPVAVLVPLALLSGVAGAFFRPLALTMSIALLISLGLALSFTPALATAVETRRAHPGRSGPGDRVVMWLVSLYRRALVWSLAHLWVTPVATALLLLLAGAAYRHVDSGFVPVMDEGAFVLDYWAPPGAALEDTEQLLTQVDDILRHTPEVSGFSRRTGAEMGFFVTEANRGDYAVRLSGGGRRGIESVIEDVRRQIGARVPGLRVEFIQVLQDMIGDLSGNPEPIEVKLFGPDAQALRPVAEQIEQQLSAIPGIVDSFNGITELGPSYDVDVDPRRVASIGRAADTVQQWLEAAVAGRVVGQVLENDRAIPVRLRYPPLFHDRIDALDGITLVTAQGGPAPLRSLARVRQRAAGVERQREDMRTLVRVTARVEGRDLGSAMRDVQQTLAHVPLPAGVTLAYGGLYASQQHAFTELLQLGAAAVACVAALLLLEFGSFTAAVVILATSSLALSGALAALWLTETALNVSSIVGMIMVVGIVAKNGILLLDRAGRVHTHGADLDAALVEAGTVRLRPILMTTLAAVAGLAPLAVGVGAGSEMQQPLAIAVLGGVSVSMVCSLFGVPMLYKLMTRRRSHAGLGG